MSLKIRVHKINDLPVLAIIGEIAGENVGKIASRLERMRDSDAKTIVVDLSETTTPEVCSSTVSCDGYI